MTKDFCQLVVRKYGPTGASVARFLGVTTSLVSPSFSKIPRDAKEKIKKALERVWVS